MKQELFIPIETFKDNFSKHLSIEDNYRIIFSGKFGIGKTTFLKEFFESNDEYEPIFIYPINYSVACNEDIFEYIKYDIIYELLKKDLYWDQVDFSKTLTAQMYLITNYKEIFKTLVENLANVIDKPFAYIFNSLKPLKEKFDEYHTEATLTTNAGIQSQIEDFFKELSIKPGSLYEKDSVSELIIMMIKALTQQIDKKLVLIIDDMDRIDPEHIFRIMNILGAHNDCHIESNNKFGFDKIILSCDINNIRNIFKNKFGDDVDFNGYVDKFYSKEIYNFNFHDEIKEYLRYIYDNTLKLNGYGVNQWEYYELIISTIRSLVEHQGLNLRKLISVKKINIEIVTNSIKYDSDIYFPMTFYVFHLYFVLSATIGDEHLLFDEINRIRKKGILYTRDHFLTRNVLKHLIYFLQYKTVKSNSENSKDFSFEYNNVLIHCQKADPYDDDVLNILNITKKLNTQGVIEEKTFVGYNFWDILYASFEKVRDILLYKD